MLSWKDYYAQEQIRQERLNEAKQERIIRMLSRRIRDERRKTRTQMLERFGYRLVEWGDAILRYASGRQPANEANMNQP